MKYVLDSSALLTGQDFMLGEMYTTPDVLEEVRKKGLTPQLRSMIEVRVQVKSPSPKSLEKVEEESQKTGDDKRLSPTDKGLLALALDLKATILTDDYSIQNLANEMGLSYKGLMFPKIKEKILWKYRCKGCGKKFAEWHKECPICGKALKTVRESTRRISSASTDRNESL